MKNRKKARLIESILSFGLLSLLFTGVNLPVYGKETNTVNVNTKQTGNSSLNFVDQIRAITIELETFVKEDLEDEIQEIQEQEETAKQEESKQAEEDREAVQDENKENTQDSQNTIVKIYPDQSDLPKDDNEPQGPVYHHSIDVSQVGPDFHFAYTNDFLNAIRAGSSFLYYPSNKEEADYSLGEVVYDYCGLDQGGGYYEGQDENGTYLEIAPDQFESLRQNVQESDAKWAAYPQQVKQDLETMNLDCTDAQMVDQINDFICRHFDYKIIDIANMPVFMDTGLGQCYHYAKLFADMCNAVGIPAEKIENQQHAWDEVTVNGKVYTFDPTFNDTGGNWTTYSWQQ